MRGIVRQGLDRAGGTQLGGGQDFFRVEGALVIVKDDPIADHGDGRHSRARMAEGCDWFRINGKPVCFEGDQATCGHASTGSDLFGLG